MPVTFHSNPESLAVLWIILLGVHESYYTNVKSEKPMSCYKRKGILFYCQREIATYYICTQIFVLLCDKKNESSLIYVRSI